MKRARALLVAFAVCLACTLGAAPAWAANGVIGGTGTAGNPYTIEDAKDLKVLATSVNGGTTYEEQFVELRADIDLSADADTATWTAIGTVAHPFKGTFASTTGQHYTISGLNVVNEDANAKGQGLFGNASGATFKDFTVVGSVTSNALATGGVVGNVANGNITMENIGGQVDVTATTSASDTGTGGVGGLVGAIGGSGGMYAVRLTSCYNKGSVSAPNLSSSKDWCDPNNQSYSGASAGGLVGRMYYSWDASVTSCYNLGPITASGGMYMGGLMGCGSYSRVQFAHCYNAGPMSNKLDANADDTSQAKYCCVGGIAGSLVTDNSLSTLTDCRYLATDDAFKASKWYTEQRYYKKLAVGLTNDSVWNEGVAQFTNSGNFGNAQTGFTKNDLPAINDDYPRLTWEPSVQNTKTPIGSATVTTQPKTYTGQPLMPDSVTVMLGTKQLGSNDFVISSVSGEHVNAGQYEVTVTGKGDYTGNAVGPFRIEKADPGLAVTDWLNNPVDTCVLDLLDNKQYGRLYQVKNTANSDGTVTVSANEPTGVVSAVLEENATSVRIKPLGVGSATVTIGISEGTNHKAATQSIATTVSWTPTPTIKSATKPTGMTLTYDGTEQTGVLEGEGYTLSGDVTGIDAGTYTATAKLKEGYEKWSDGSTAASREVKWYINPADAVITLSTDRLSLVAGAGADSSVTVTSKGANALKAASDSKGVASVELKDGKLVITPLAQGTALISVSGQPESDNYASPASKVLAVYVSEADPDNPQPGPGPDNPDNPQPGPGPDNPDNPDNPQPGPAAKTDISTAKATVPSAQLEYTSKALTQDVTVTLDGKKLVKDTDFTVAWADNVEVGLATATITGTGSYTGECSASFRIVHTDTRQGLTDLDPNAWYMNEVGGQGAFPGTKTRYLDYTIANGLMTGKKNADGSITTFDPNGNLTRAESAMVLYRLGNPTIQGNGPSQANTTGLPDVESNAWYTAAVNWCVANGVITGYKDAAGNPTAFGTNDLVTREQLATMIGRYCTEKAGMNSAGSDVSGFADKANIATFAYAGVAFCNANGIMTGVGGTKNFDPKANAQRCQMAKIIAVTHKLVNASQVEAQSVAPQSTTLMGGTAQL